MTDRGPLLEQREGVADPGRHAVLVVDDDLAIRRLVSTLLSRRGYNVDTAADGLEAVLKLGVIDFDVIILDLMMPNLDGFTFIDTFARHEPERLRKIIVTSAASAATIRERTEGLELRVLAKPFDINALMSIVDEVIEASGGSETAPS
jgi:CheY-like chemotaxis protein